MRSCTLRVDADENRRVTERLKEERVRLDELPRLSALRQECHLIVVSVIYGNMFIWLYVEF